MAALLENGYAELRMFLPLERTPIKCTCRVQAGKLERNNTKSYSARVLINHISRMDLRRLELFVDRKRAFIGIGSGGYFSYAAA